MHRPRDDADEYGDGALILQVASLLEVMVVTILLSPMCPPSLQLLPVKQGIKKTKTPQDDAINPFPPDGHFSHC